LLSYQISHMVGGVHCRVGHFRSCPSFAHCGRAAVGVDLADYCSFLISDDHFSLILCGYRLRLGSSAILLGHLLLRSHYWCEQDETEPEYVSVLAAAEPECHLDDPLLLVPQTRESAAISPSTSLSPLSAPIQTFSLESVHFD
jgi:hypothetical protein